MNESAAHSLEQKRLSVLRSYHILDTLQEKDFDDITMLAAAICQVPVALISLVDENRQWFKSHIGLEITETPRSQSFCAHAIASSAEIMVVEDAHEDERFKNNPLVTGEPGLTFYAGVPLVTEEGMGLGTLCVIDSVSRILTNDQVTALKLLAKRIIDRLELRKKLLELEEKNKRLEENDVRIKNLMGNLKQNEERVKSFIQQAPVAIIIFRGKDLLIEEANASMLQLLGKDTGILNKPLLDAIPELKGQPAYKLLCKVFDSGEVFYGHDVPVQLKRNGKIENGYYNFTYSPLIENGKITGIIDTAVETTEQVIARQTLTINNTELISANETLSTLRKELEDALKSISDSEERFRTMAEGTNILIAVGDATGNSTYFNRAWSDVTGRAVEDLVSFGWADLVHPDDRERYMNMYLTAFKERVPFTGEFRLLNKEGDYQWLLATGPPRFSKSNTFEGYISSCIDITEQKKDEQRKNDFISIVSHELKTPLTALKASIQTLQMVTEDSKEPFVQQGLERADRQVTKMNTLINGFLNVSLLDSGKIQINAHRFNMATLVAESEKEIYAVITNHIFEFAPVEDSYVFADSDKIAQVISNLLSNAAKYSPIGSTIQVACITANNEVVFSVRDQGLGLAKEDAKKIFDRFYRVENNKTHTISGFGIGLYLSAEIIQRHNGKIWVESEPGMGSVFYFSLPSVE